MPTTPVQVLLLSGPGRLVFVGVFLNAAAALARQVIDRAGWAGQAAPVPDGPAATETS